MSESGRSAAGRTARPGTLLSHRPAAADARTPPGRTCAGYCPALEIRSARPSLTPAECFRPRSGPGRIAAMGDAGTFMATPVGLSLLAEVAGLDLWDFMEQIGESIPGTTLKASPSGADAPGPGHGPAAARPRRQAPDVVTDHVAAVASSLDQLA